MPTELDDVRRRVMQLEIEEAALKKERNKGSLERLEAIQNELAELRAKGDGMKAQWESEKQAIKKVQALREEIEKIRRDIEVAQREYNLQQAAELTAWATAGTRAATGGRGATTDRQTGGKPPAARGSDRGGNCRNRLALDRYSGDPTGGG